MYEKRLDNIFSMYFKKSHKEGKKLLMFFFFSKSNVKEYVIFKTEIHPGTEDLAPIVVILKSMKTRSEIAENRKTLWWKWIRKQFNWHGQTRWFALETNLLTWILEQRNNGQSVSTVKIHLQTKSMLTKWIFQTLKGGVNWVYPFMRGNNWKSLIKDDCDPSQSSQLERKKNALFIGFTKRIIEEGNYLLINIIKIEEVPLMFDCPNQTHNTHKGVKCHH